MLVSERRRRNRTFVAKGLSNLDFVFSAANAYHLYVKSEHTYLSKLLFTFCYSGSSGFDLAAGSISVFDALFSTAVLF